MKFNKTVENNNYKFTIDFEDNTNNITVGSDNYLCLSNTQNLIDTLYRSPKKKHLTLDNCKTIDKEYQTFLEEVYAINKVKYKKEKLDYNYRRFEDMQKELRNNIKEFQNKHGFSDKKMKRLLKSR